MVEEKKSDDNTDYFTYGLIAGGVVLAGAALWYLSNPDVDTDNIGGAQ